eukprot:TRINITY_DN21108_c0_g1_i1.p1 TRINITY_DN21108_c0_g1~~TRINITY_DN21108_c0_g1_i1.p1  ORF type:complete len:404 (+),score=126.41 TRINITY_DN21108_c0_g1_i1:79-1290(+)
MEQQPSFPVTQLSWADEMDMEDSRRAAARAGSQQWTAASEPGTDEALSSDATQRTAATARRDRRGRRRGTGDPVPPLQQRRSNGRGSGSDSASHRFPGVPWLGKAQRGAWLSLADEMGFFATYVGLSAAEVQAREAAVDFLGRIASRTWSSSATQAYGSFAYGLSLSTSDLDVAVDGCQQLGQGVDAFVSLAQDEGYEVLGLVSNPADAFVKLRGPQGFACNVSVTAGRSPVREGLRLVHQLLAAHPQVRPCVLVLRTVLSQCQLTDVSNGGISSYCILLLALRLAQYREPDSAPDAGRLLRDFLSHYSSEFDFGACTAFVTREQTVAQRLHPESPVSIADPLDAANNVALGCTKVRQICAMLRYCQLALARWEAPDDQDDALRMRTALCTIIAAKAVSGRRK